MQKIGIGNMACSNGLWTSCFVLKNKQVGSIHWCKLTEKSLSGE